MNDKTESKAPSAPVVNFDYIKGTNFRSIRADGAIGAVTPNGHIHMALYSERTAIPRRAVYEVLDHGKVGDVREIESRGSIVREMDVDIFFNLETAESVYEWLGERISECKQRKENDGGNN